MKDNEMKEQKRLERLMGLPNSKRVLAFEVIMLEDLREYVDWAIAGLEASLGQEIDEALLLVACLYDENPINYFEMKQQLQALARMLHLVPPQGAEAVRLYCFGLVEGKKPGDCFEEYDLQQELETLLDPYPKIRDFDSLKNWKGNFWAPREEKDDQLTPFQQKVEELSKKWYISVEKEQNHWLLKIKERHN